MLLLTLLLGLGSVASSDHDIVSALPTRPASSAELRVAIGTVTKIIASTRGVLETTLTLRENDGHTRQYLLSNVTHVNGRTITCFQSAGGPWKSACSAQQLRITPGKTRIAVLYWPLSSGALVPKDARGTDMLVIVSP